MRSDGEIVNDGRANTSDCTLGMIGHDGMLRRHD